GAPATYSSSESGVEKRTAFPSAPCSIECASTPKPKYGCRVQYFRLCRDSQPSQAKFEISYCLIPAALSFSQAISYKSAVTSSSGTKCAWYFVPPAINS